MAKNYTVKKTINGTDYTAQFAGLSVALKAADETHIDGTDVTSVEKMAEYLFEHVIVDPKGLNVDDFGNMKELNEVIKFASDVMKGEFREAADDGAAKEKGEK